MALLTLSAAIHALPAHAQRGAADERTLHQRIAERPDDLQRHIDLISFYLATGRVGDAARMTAAALGRVRSMRENAKQPSIVLTEPPANPALLGAAAAKSLRIVRSVEPAYPPEAFAKRIGGFVSIEIIINAQGAVADARVTRSAPAFDAAALDAVRQWEFAPFFHNGVPVPIKTTKTFTFIPELSLTRKNVLTLRIEELLTQAARFSAEGAYANAEFVLGIARAIMVRERSTPNQDAGSGRNGTVTSSWPVLGGIDIRVPPKTKHVAPVYSVEGVEPQLRGIVSFDFVIDPAGKVTEIRHAGGGDPSLQHAARAAIEQWEYAPTVVGADPIPVAMTVALAFAPGRPAQEVVRVGADIQEPRKLKDVRPVYPPEAIAKRITGVVIIEAILDIDGKVRDATVIRSMGDLLDRAAIEAVRKWEFTPTTYGGVPVQVVMTVTVAFSID